MKKASNPPPPNGAERPAPPPAPPRPRSGRGGARTAGHGKTLGAPKKAAAELTVVKGPYRLPPDVNTILGRQRNATAYICEAVRAFNADLELETAIASCRCGQDYVIVNDFGVCPSGCERDAARVSESGGLTIPT